MENALRESEEKFSRAFQSSPAALTIADLATVRTWKSTEPSSRSLAIDGMKSLDDVGMDSGYGRIPQIEMRPLAAS